MFDMEQNKQTEIKPTKIVLSFKNETLTLQNIPATRYSVSYMLINTVQLYFNTQYTIM